MKTRMLVTRAQARRRTRRGFSLMEVVIATSVSIGFALVVSTALVSTSSAARDTIGQASLQQAARQVSETASRYLHGAASPGTCTAPVGAARVSLCDRIGEAGPAFETATAASAVFYTYGTTPGDVSTPGGLRVPDRVEITLAADRLTISRYAADPAAEYVAPAWSSTAEVVRVADARGATGAFAYYDAAGQLIPEADLATPAGRETIALVAFTPRLTMTAGADTYTSAVDVFAAVGAPQDGAP